jgi:hypothetical protein
MAFYNPEPNFWMALAVTVPYSQKQKKDTTVTVYHDENVQNVVLQSLLKQTYSMYKLFNGTFASVLAEFNRETLVSQTNPPLSMQPFDRVHSFVLQDHAAACIEQ